MEKMMATLVHISTNMWREADNSAEETNEPKVWDSSVEIGSPRLRLDKTLWDEYMVQLKEAGCNTLILDIGDGMVYDTHPEIAVEGAWTKAEMKAEIEKLRGMGFELVPKLNFSATHDYWMKDYARMVSTEPYYRFCADVIGEICDLFRPKYFHIGMDEERYELQEKYDYVVIRQHKAWWKDVLFYIAEVEKHGVRVMMWADHAWRHMEEFLEYCPRSVIPINWYYHSKFYGELDEYYAFRVRPMKQLIEAGFDLITCGTTVFEMGNFEALAEYSKNHLDQEKLIGMIQTTWQAVIPEYRQQLQDGIDTLKRAMEIWRS